MRKTRCTFVLLAWALLGGAAPAQRNLKNIPDPDPELERQTFILPEGFEVNLYAADPRIAKPIQMNFDARGRLWVASSEVYPHIKPGQQPTDKILVLEDRDRDGRADRTTIFADGLLIPTGVLPGDDGVYVANSTELLHLSDADGDGAADRRRVVLSGFGAEDTHHLLHTLRWVHDGAMTMNQSIYIHSHVETPWGVRRLNGGGIWRFRPDSLRLDVFCRGFVNPWGHHTDRWGQSFATDGAYGEGINYVFPGAVYVTAPGAKRRVEGLNPGSPKHCGLEIASGEHLPESWRGSMLTNDFRAHRVCRFVVMEDGSGYRSRQEVEVIKSSHVAFRPIDVKMGPDGAIYIADWYNPIIQHGEVDFRDPRRDHVHGRIWRVTAKGRPLVEPPDYASLDTPQLLEQLRRGEDWIRLHAKRELARRDPPQVLAAAQQWLAALEDDPQIEHHRLELLWLRQTMRQLDRRLLESLLASADHRARAAAVRDASLWGSRLDDPLALFAAAARDEHPRVRLEAVRALSQLGSYEAAAAALQALDQPTDRFLDFALWQAMRDLEGAWLPKIRSAERSFGGNVDHLAFALQAVDSPDVAAPLIQLLADGQIPDQRLAPVVDLIGSLATPQQTQQLLDLIDGEGWSDSQRATALMSIAATASWRPAIRPPTPPARRLAKWLESGDDALRRAALRAIGSLQATQLTEAVAAAAGTANDGQRQAALAALADLGTPQARQVLLEQSRQGPPDSRAAAVAAMARVDLDAAARQTLQLLSLPTPPDAEPLVSSVLARKNGEQALSKALGGARLPAEAAKRALRAARGAGASQAVVDAIRAAGSLAEAKWAATPELIQALAAESQQTGDPHRGQEIYRRRELQCFKCHAIAGSGGKVGPDLISLGASAQPDYLVESLLNPNAKVKENYHSLSVQTDDGLVVNGVLVRRSDDELVLRDKDDQEVTIRTAEIVAEKESRSLMPDGTVDELTRGELVDLVRFLSELGKVGEFAVGRRPLVRTWRVLLPTKEAYQRIRRTSYDTAASDDPALQFEPAYSRVSGELPLDELPGFVAATYVTRQPSAPTVFLRCRFEVSQAGDVRLAWNDTTGLTLWADGKPRPLAATQTFDWTPGVHDLTIAVNRDQRKTPLRLELLEDGTTAAASIVGGK